MSEQKPKKPFLKRGTRQFLSNAQIRSLNQKPRIVEFQDEDFEQSSSPFVNSTIAKKEAKEQIVISVKPKNLPRDKSQSGLPNSKPNAKKSNNLTDKTKQTRNETNIEENVAVSAKPSSNNHSSSKSSQKKPTLLADYLNNDSKSTKKPTQQTPASVQIPKTLPVKQNYQPSVQSQAQHLKMQDLDDDSDDDHHKPKQKFNQDDQDINEFISKRQKSESSPEEIKKVEPAKKKPNLLQDGLQNKKQKENFNLQNKRPDEKSEKSQDNEVNFHSDSESDEKQKKNQFKKKATKTLHQNRFKEDAEENQQVQNSDDQEQINRKATVKMSAKPQSKVAQMFNKGSNQKATQQTFTNDPQPTKSKMAIDDVPKQLIEEIVQKYFKQAKQKYEKKQQNLFQQVKVVEKKQDSLNEQEKNLEKRVKEFEKQMEEKNKEFENKIKNQQNKITREKMYLKDQQTTGKADWKTKNEIQELRQQLEEQRNERKRIQVKLKGQLDRLKAKYNEDMQVKKNLENRIKEYELRDIKERQIKAKEEKQQKQQIIQKKKSFWDDVPKQTYLQRFYAKDFTLSEFLMEDYFYEHNEFYQYYKEKGDSDVLQMEQNEGNKIKRTYENGKVQIESSKKFVKEIFPWGFIIVHYINGDVKQVIQMPKDSKSDNTAKQMQIYYAKNSQIIEYTIADGKHIHYFLADDQIQLKDELVELREVYTGNQLQRIKQGVGAMYQKNAKGKFVEMY